MSTINLGLFIGAKKNFFTFYVIGNHLKGTKFSAATNRIPLVATGMPVNAIGIPVTATRFFFCVLAADKRSQNFNIRKNLKICYGG